jgi:hypothetical protein
VKFAFPDVSKNGAVKAELPLHCLTHTANLVTRQDLSSLLPQSRHEILDLVCLLHGEPEFRLQKTRPRLVSVVVRQLANGDLLQACHLF